MSIGSKLKVTAQSAQNRSPAEMILLPYFSSNSSRHFSEGVILERNIREISGGNLKSTKRTSAEILQKSREKFLKKLWDTFWKELSKESSEKL